MELLCKIMQEIKLRDEGKRGCLENLSNLEVFCLAYKLGIIKIPQPKLRE